MEFSKSKRDNKNNIFTHRNSIRFDLNESFFLAQIIIINNNKLSNLFIWKKIKQPRIIYILYKQPDRFLRRNLRKFCTCKTKQ